MSHLHLPRVHFLGKLWVNTATANNGVTYPSSVNQNDPQIMDPAVAKVDTFDKTAAEFKAWLQETNTATNQPNAWWNYFGDSGVWFDGAKVTGTHVDTAGLVTDPSGDPLVGAEVNLRGSLFFDRRGRAVIVDLNPVGAFSTQLFSGQFVLGPDSAPLLKGDLPRRAHSYWVGFWRNLAMPGDTGATAVWQLALPKAHLQINAPVSPALAALQAGVAAGEGLLVRICSYMIGRGGAPELPAQNPRPLVLVGTIGVWENGEPASVPTGRLLYPDVNAPLTIPQEIQTRRPSRSYFLSPALAKVDRKRKVIALDLINTIPERAWTDITDQPPTAAPEKIDYGTLSLLVRGAGSQLTIGDMPFSGYNRDAYLASGGIVDLPYSAEPGAGDLVLIAQSDAGEQQLLSEIRYDVVSDDRGIYLEEGETREIVVKVFEHGETLSGPVDIELQQVVSSIAGELMVELAPDVGAVHDFRSAPKVAKAGIAAVENQVLEIPANVKVDLSGSARIPVKAVRAGIAQVFFVTPAGPTLTGSDVLDGLYGFFVNIRVLPKEDFSDKSDEFIDTNWEYMYDTVFKYFDLLYPRMSQIIDFSNEGATASAATLIKAMTDPGGFESTAFMPVTRDLPPGRRALLQRWCSIKQSQGGG